MSDLISEINRLYKKSKEEGLTDEEKALQEKLRNEYRQNVRNNFVGQLDNIYIVDEKGNQTKLTKK
ncbi:MAG: DUF896 domain-containing protein [Clostridia bacterium]|nr:DUF896 domain-containing protein [Clostridia bacterium]MDY5264404.1 DUF896 domain-containing protein [Eubacteriales bacterium]